MVDPPKFYTRRFAVEANPAPVVMDLVLGSFFLHRESVRCHVEDERDGLDEQRERYEEEVVFLRVIHEAVAVVLAGELVPGLPQRARLVQHRREVAERWQ